MADLRYSAHSGVLEAEEGRLSLFKNFSKRASLAHSRVPYLSKLPFAAVAIIITLIIVNILVWAAVGVVLVCVVYLTQSREIRMFPDTL